MKKTLLTISTFLLFLATPILAHAAVTEVQNAPGGNNFGGTSAGVNFGSNVTAGDTILVTASWVDYTGTPTVTSLVDTLGNTFIAKPANGYTPSTDYAGMEIQEFYVLNSPGGADSFTATWSSSTGGAYLSAIEISPSVFDQIVQTQGNSFSPSAGSVTTTTNGEFGNASAIQDNAEGFSTFSGGSGWTLWQNGAGGAQNNGQEYQAQSTAGSITGNFSSPFTGEWAADMILFKPASSPPTTLGAFNFEILKGEGFIISSAIPGIVTTHTDVQTFTSNGTWTAPAGTITNVEVEAFGGGGGGGGAAIGHSSGAGAAGAYVVSNITSSFPSSATITIGQGGVGGTSATGGAGGAGCFTGGNGAFLTASSGGGGGGSTCFVPNSGATITASAGGGGAPNDSSSAASGSSGGNGSSGAGIGGGGGGGASGTNGGNASGSTAGTGGTGGTTQTGTNGGSTSSGGGSSAGGSGNGNAGTSGTGANGSGGASGGVAGGLNTAGGNGANGTGDDSGGGGGQSSIGGATGGAPGNGGVPSGGGGAALGALGGGTTGGTGGAGLVVVTTTYTTTTPSIFSKGFYIY